MAEAIQQIHPACKITFVGTPRGLESQLIPAEGFALKLISMVPLSSGNRIALPFALVRSFLQARRFLKDSGVDVVLGMGGYPSVPAVLAARSLSLPLVIHESGAVLGRANLLAARFTSHVALAFQHTEGRFPKGSEPRVVGMPLREQITSIDRVALRDEARRQFGFTDRCTVLLVMGGSQGASSLNAVAIELGRRWGAGGDTKILLKTGQKHLDTVREQVEEARASDAVSCVGFIERMDLAYAAADVALSRAGAGTVAELSVLGLPAVLVPYPHAPRDHQALNARELLDAGGAWMVRDHELTADVVAPLIEQLSKDPSQLRAMSSAAASVGRPGAARQTAEWVLSLAGTKGSQERSAGTSS